ncbi:MAG: NfeD family protein [Ruminococcaceae bacterium]|nr:NfeD family protein [Oscillospiraceae bacterium]
MTQTTIFWLVAVIALGVVEAVTVGLVSVWFALGALAALISSLFGGPLWLQIVLFIVVSALALIITRPLVKKYFNKESHKPTNADMVIGKEAQVTETIDNLQGTGAVRCMGKEWTARSENGETILSGETVTAVKIEGVKLIVRKL